MRVRRYLLTCAVLFAVALVWNGFVHLVLLRQAGEAVRHVLRADLQRTAWLSFLVTAGIVALFVWGYGRFARIRTAGEAARYGLFFGLLAGLLVDLNQYVLYPLPGWVAVAWFTAGLIEFQVYAVIVRWLLPPLEPPPARA